MIEQIAFGLVFQDVRAELRHGWKIETKLVVEVPPGRREHVSIVGHDGLGAEEVLLDNAMEEGR